MTRSQENKIQSFKNADMEIREIRTVGKSIMVVLKNRVAFIGKRGKVDFKRL